MYRILCGMMRTHRTTRIREMVKQQSKQISNHSNPKVLFFACMDSRVVPTRYTAMNVGDMFLVRNAGNIIPNAKYLLNNKYISCEPAALELGCIMNNIRHIVVCGHSDCKAMNLLHHLRDSSAASKSNRCSSALSSWVYTHGSASLEKYLEWESNSMKNPLIFTSDTPLKMFEANIDPENNLCIEDKLSQINTLQQMINIATYDFLRKCLELGHLFIHALWFDVHTGDVHYFSRREKRFIVVDESSIDLLLYEVKRFYS